MNAIEMKHVTKSYASFRLNDVSLSLPSGCIMGLVGDKGAGKSTTIPLIMNTVQKETGEILVLGKNNTSEDFKQVKEDIGIVLDEAYYPEVLSPANVSRIMRHT